MKPLIFISPDFQPRGAEFNDGSLSLSLQYARAIAGCGGLPVAMLHEDSRALAADYVGRCDGVLMTGGEDVSPELHSPKLSRALKSKAVVTEDGGRRDLFELMLLDEVFRQRKPLLAICRGHQLLNVALGGTLLVDIPTQKPSRINHRQMDRKSEMVHSVRLTHRSLLAKIVGARALGVNSTHHQAVDKPAGALEVVARSSDGMIEALEQKHAGALLPFLVSVQFHPERLQARHTGHRAIFEAFIAACRMRNK